MLRPFERRLSCWLLTKYLCSQVREPAALLQKGCPNTRQPPSCNATSTTGRVGGTKVKILSWWKGGSLHSELPSSWKKARSTTKKKPLAPEIEKLKFDLAPSSKHQVSGRSRRDGEWGGSLSEGTCRRAWGVGDRGRLPEQPARIPFRCARGLRMRACRVC